MACRWARLISSVPADLATSQVVADSPQIAIIGGGLGGICMGIKLREAGYHNFTIYEKAGQVGGTWRDNTYPGIACDVPSHLYSYSFELNPDWSHAYSPGWEIQQYSEECVNKYGLARHLKLNTNIVQNEFREGRWRLSDSDGNSHTADVLVSAMGGLHLPQLPDIDGRESFAGPAFHSPRWDHDVDLSGKRIAVIGSAASAIQIVPSLAANAAQLYVYQRTPNWIIPRRDHAFSRPLRWIFRRVPGAARLYRWLLYWVAELRWPSFINDSLFNRLGRYLGVWHLRLQVSDPALRARLTPDYAMGCKRILRSDDYYPALQRDNVELVTDPITRIEADAVVTAGGRQAVDVIIYATGFDVFDIVGQTQFIGPGGDTLSERWSDSIKAHRTIAVPGFPNLFMLQGPNSALGHNSVIFMIEAQVRYVIACLDGMRQRDWKTMMPTEQAFADYQSDLTRRLDRMIWSSGCRSWYQDASGHVFTLWPHTCTTYWHRMRRPDFSEYEEFQGQFTKL